jgi:hypothetical protein
MPQCVINPSYRCVNSFWSDALLTAKLIRSVRCRSGTAPSFHIAFCNPSLKLSKLSEKQIVAVSQFEYVSTK